ESHPRQPQSPYSATKIGADAIAKSFYNAFDLPVVIARPFNAYGPRQSARAIIPTIITQILSGKEKLKLGDLSPTRDFNYVEDLAEGFIALGETAGIEGREINIASGMEISMADTLATIARLMGVTVADVVTDPERLRPAKSEVNRLCGDNTLITTLTDWRPRHSFEEGLLKTIDWFRQAGNMAGYKPEIYNR
ncbi:MAG: GDP-mannose 4,6-dehydratase, partial [Muribaculaceae bacterium]|nr:GDP-mannose 4,6-dehydratase [Muribaculaceae bacterium]